ncbi:MAG: 16S rRNA (adenine(1518)-N(6)/adenine(1519)-N(6))-dimethyltransferase RsmA [bacterium]
MPLLSEIKLICKQHNIIPSREMGQNFLINEDVYQRIIEVAGLSKKDVVLEVGPGLGILTRLLCKNSKRVVAVELDEKIFNYLKIIKELEKLDNLELLNQNILDFKIADLSEQKVKVVANLPYNITSIFLRKFLHFLAEEKIDEMVLMLQKEVAERIVSGAGQMSLLSLSAQFYCDPEIVEYVDKNNFWPQPKVDSAIIKLKPIGDLKDKKLRLETDEKVFFQIARIGFSAKRKKLVNNLANGLRKNQSEILPFLSEVGLNGNARAQELNVEQWIRLTHIINNSK